MIINFEKLWSLVPDNGKLTIVAMKSGENLIVSITPKYLDKRGNEVEEEGASFAPMTFSGLPKDLQIVMAEVNDVVDLQRTYLSFPEPTKASGVSKSKDAIKKKFDEKKQKSTPASSKTTVKTAAAKAEVKEQKPADKNLSLFTSGAPVGDEQKALGEPEASSAGTSAEETPTGEGAAEAEGEIETTDDDDAANTEAGQEAVA